MAIIYRTDGVWGTGQGSNLSPAQVDGNFYDLDTRVTYWEDNPPLPIEPVSITITGYNFSMGLSNGETLGPVTMTMPVPQWRGAWTPSTVYHDMDFITSPDGGFGAVMLGHASAATFDWAAISESGLPLYRQIVGPTGETTSLTDLNDVSVPTPADGDVLTWDAGTSLWRNEPATGGTVTVDWADITGKPATFPPTVPIAQADVTNLVSDLALKAPLASPVFTGTPSLPSGASGVTRGASDNSAALATTAFVQSVVAALPPPGSGTITGVTAGAGLSGGGTSGTVTVSLATPVAITSGGTNATSSATALDNLSGASGATAGALQRSSGGAWSVSAISGASVTISATPPASPAAGDLWWDSGTTGNLHVYYNDGSSSQWVVAVALPPAVAKYNIAFSFTGGVLAASQLLGLHRVSKAITIPANFGAVGGHASQAGGTANATASAVISVHRALAASPNSFSQVGTITFAAGTITPTFATSGGAAVSVAQGDVVRLVGPATADTTLANVYATLVGTET